MAATLAVTLPVLGLLLIVFPAAVEKVDRWLPTDGQKMAVMVVLLALVAGQWSYLIIAGR